MKVQKDPTNKLNLKFYETIQNQHLSTIDKDIDLSIITQRIAKIKLILEELTKEQTIEWAEIHCKKLQELFTEYRENKLEKMGHGESSKILREHLRILVFCAGLNIDYHAKKVSQMIREVYFAAYQQKALAAFVKVGFSIAQFENLSFQDKQEDQDQSGFFSFLCCCSRKPRR